MIPEHVIVTAHRDRQAMPVADGAAAVLPLSAAQLPIWLAEMLRRGTSRWTQVGVVHLEGPLDPARFEAAIVQAVAHYPALRCCIVRERGRVGQRFHDAADFAVERHTLAIDAPASDGDAAPAVARFLDEAACYRFALVGSWLFKADLLVISPERAVLVLRVHHIAADGIAFPLILDHIATAYRGSLAPPGLPDRIFLNWLDAQTREPSGLSDALGFYNRLLQDAPVAYPALYDDDAAGTTRDETPHEPPLLPEVGCTLAPAVGDGLARLAERSAATLFIVCLAAYATALAEALAERDLVIGVFVAGRGGTAGLVAMAINTVLVRLRLDEEPAAPLERVRSVREAWRPVRRLEGLPIHTLREASRQSGGAVPDQVSLALNFLDLRRSRLDLPEIATRVTHTQQAFPLNDLVLLMLREQDGSLQLRLINGSGTRRLSRQRLQRLLDGITDVLRAWSTMAPDGTPPPAEGSADRRTRDSQET